MYRLTQYDLNGEIGEKKNVIIEVNSNTNVSVFPNPSNDVININIESDVNENNSITIYDLSGRQVFNHSVSSNKGHNAYILNPELSDGAYIIKISNEMGVLHSERLIINR